MSEMIERVACAIFGHWRNVPRLSDADITAAWVKLDPSLKEAWRVSAHFAINSMREPTDDMWRAGLRGLNEYGGNSIEVWKFMIDEALK